MSKLLASIMLLVVTVPLVGSSRVDYKNAPIMKAYPTATKSVVAKEVSNSIGGQFIPFDTVSKGDTVGCTQYDRQWNMSPLRRVIWDPRNNYTHVTWMKQLTTGGVLRHTFYNCYDGTQWLWPGLDGGTAVQTGNRDGYPAMDIDTAGNPVVVCHKNAATEPAVYYKTCIYRDLMPGMGSFELVKEFNNVAGDSQDLWPRVAVDGANNMIALACADSTLGQPKTNNKLYYSRCSGDSLTGGGNWSPWAVVDTNTGTSYNVFASKKPGSTKMCIGWNKDVLESGIWDGHMMYMESQDGGKTWSSVLDVMGLIPDLGPHHYYVENLKGSIGNTYGIYDADDNIHMVTDASLGTTTEGSYYPSLSCVIWHYSSETDSVNMVSWHNYPMGLKWAPASAWSEVLYPYYGGLQAKPVIAEDPVTKYLYVIWIEFPMDTFSINGYESGEIFASYSLDRGRTWAPKMNLTNTPAMCEVFASMAPIVNDTLHMLYMFDPDGYDDIIQNALDPNKCPFFSYKEPVKRGDVEVLSINAPAGALVDTLIPGTIYTPNVTYKNNGATSVDFQARFEINTYGRFLLGDSINSDTLDTPLAWYYNVQNVTLAAGDTIQVSFKPWMCDSMAYGVLTAGYYSAYATMLVDTILANNVKEDSFVVDSIGVEEIDGITPKAFTLSQTYPNPITNGIANINYSIATSARVTIKVYDVSGKLVKTVSDRTYRPGTYTEKWNGTNEMGNKVSAGLYFYRVNAGGSDIGTRKIVLMR